MRFGMKIPREKLCFYSSFNPERSSASEIIAAAGRLGLGGVELMSFCEELGTPDMAVARELGRQARALGLKLPCFSVGIDLITEGEAGLERLYGYADICSELQIPYLHHTVALDFVSGDITDGVREERFLLGADYALRLMEYARPLGVRTVIEDQGFVFNGIENCKRLHALSGGGIGIVADVGNILFRGERPEDFIRAFGGEVCHAHLKDAIISDTPRKTGVWYPVSGGRYLSETQIGEGDIDFGAVNTAFRAIGYRGMYSLEFPGGTDEAMAVRTVRLLSE